MHRTRESIEVGKIGERRGSILRIAARFTTIPKPTHYRIDRLRLHLKASDPPRTFVASTRQNGREIVEAKCSCSFAFFID